MIETWQERLGIPAHCKPRTGEEAAMCAEIAELRERLAGSVFVGKEWLDAQTPFGDTCLQGTNPIFSRRST